MARSPSKADGTYVHVFAYCVPKRDREEMRRIETRLNAIYRRHGNLGLRLYVWGPTTIFQGFVGLQKQLGATPEDELWLEIDSYEGAAHLKAVAAAVGADKEAAPLWERLARIVGPGRAIAMGEFEQMAV